MHTSKINRISRQVKDAKNLKSVTFAEDSKLKEIGESAFESAYIEYIKIPRSVEKIGKNTFNNCKNLSSIKFTDDSNLKIIGDNAFKGTNIESIEIPRSVTIILDFAFSGCFKLKSVTLAWSTSLNPFIFHRALCILMNMHSMIVKA